MLRGSNWKAMFKICERLSGLSVKSGSKHALALTGGRRGGSSYGLPKFLIVIVC